MAFTSEQRKEHRAKQKALKSMMQMPKALQLLKFANEVAKTLPARASNDALIFDSVICDWLTIVHPLRKAHPVVNDGQILRIKADGSTEWTTECWKTIKCASSDTSLRIKCDGQTVKMTGNIGRFGQADNLQGYTVAQCVEKWRLLLAQYYPDVVADFFGKDFEMVNRLTGEVQLSGTRITRCDLAGNFDTDNFAALSAQLMTHRIGQIHPRAGKYGPTWGYDSKRANWFRAKVYDKTCELEGRRTPATGATTARFEVQLGSELLKRKGLHVLSGWAKEKNMENVTYLEYSKQVFRDQATAETWQDIPPRLRQYAVLWRDGTPLRNQCKSDATYYRIRKALLEHGIDASQPCNVMTLTRRIEVVKVMPLPARRAA
jgi:hypothetical protein